MSMSQLLRDRPIVGMVFVVAIVGLVVLINLRRGNPAPASGRWFYDLTTGDLVQVATSDPPPIMLDSGHEAVWAHVFSCGDCADVNQRFVGYLEKFNDEAAAPEPAPVDPNSPLTPSGSDPLTRSLVASPNAPDQWVIGASPQAAAMRNAVMQHCRGGAPKPCRGSE
jgi:hypothetical protein